MIGIMFGEKQLCKSGRETKTKQKEWTQIIKTYSKTRKVPNTEGEMKVLNTGRGVARRGASKTIKNR